MLEFVTLTLSTHEVVGVSFFVVEEGGWGGAVFYWFVCRCTFLAGREGLCILDEGCCWLRTDGIVICAGWLTMFEILRGATEEMQGRKTSVVSPGSLDGHLSQMLRLLQNPNGQVVNHVMLHIISEKETNQMVNGVDIGPAIDPLSSLLFKPSFTKNSEILFPP